MDTDKRIVEIGGVKVEYDLRTAKQVDTFKVGDPVKLLVKEYDSHKVKYGVIIDFANFTELPSIVVAYLDGWSNDHIKFEHVNADSKDIQIAPCSEDEISIDKHGIESNIDKKIAELKGEIRDLEENKRIFRKRFGEMFDKDKLSEINQDETKDIK